MPRTVTVTFDDGAQHVYNNVPDTVTPDAIEQRVATEFAGKRLTGIDGGRTAPQEKAAPTVSFGPESFRKSLGEAIAADPSPAGAQLVAGAGSALDQWALRLKQLVSGLTPQDQQQVQANRMLSSTPLGFAGNVAGNVGMFGALPMATLPTAAAGGAAISTLTNPVLPGESEIRNALGGAAGGAVGNVVGRGLARVGQPIRQSAPVRALLNEGVVPTPGQAAGAGSLLGRLEQGFQSVRGPGDIITHGRQRAIEEFNRAATNRALPPGAKEVSQVGRAGLEEAEQALSAAYDKVFAGRLVRPDAALKQSVDQAINAPVMPLSAEGVKAFNSAVKRNLWDRMSGGGSFDAGNVKSEVIGDLGKVARQHLDSPLASEQAVGEALMAARNAVQGWLSGTVSSGNPAVAQQIAAIDRAYANKIGIEKAVERAKATPGGMFTPNQLQSATKPRQALRDFANAGQDVLSSRVPNSGTVDRAGLLMLLGAGGGVANEYYGGPGYLTALAAAPLIYSRAGSRYMIGDLPGQQAVAQGLASLLPLTTQAGRIAGQNN